MDKLRGLLCVRKIDRVLNGLAKVSSDGSAMWRDWRMTGLLRGSMQGSVLVVTQRVVQGRGGLIP